MRLLALLEVSKRGGTLLVLDGLKKSAALFFAMFGLEIPLEKRLFAEEL